MKKILIVEDNVEIAGLLRDVLLKEGFAVVLSPDGGQGVEAMRREEPDLILLDLMMPDKDGFYLLEQKALAPETRDIPVVVLTASKDTRHAQKAITGMRVDAFVEKPYDARKLVMTVRGFLN